MIRRLPTLCLVSCSLWLASCSSNKTPGGVPSVLPNINLHGSTATPSHRMSSTEYPFAPNGDYVQSWAAAGGGAPAASDYNNWRSSHHSSGSSSSARKSTSSSSSYKKKTTKSSSTRHTVRSGDTLSGIARRYGTSVARIKSANGLKSDVIRDGRTLVIPR